MIRLALTGGIACGKSRAGALLEQRGVAICEADLLAHEALDGAARDGVIREFGREIIALDGRVDRRRLGGIVFGSPERRMALERLIHPVVVEQWIRWMRLKEAERVHCVCVIVPLLFEGGFHEGWDAILVVVSSPGLQRERLMARGLTPEEAEARIHAQMSLDEKMRRADHVIINDGSLAVLEDQLDRALRRVRSE